MVFRLVRARHAHEALSGEGARAFGGRWNPPGYPVVYASASRALAALETLVHLTHEAHSLSFVMFAISLPDDATIERYHGPAAQWRAAQPTAASQQAGREWLGRGRSLALAAPSLIVPDEPSFVLDVRHPDFGRLKISDPEPFAFDERLWSS